MSDEQLRGFNEAEALKPRIPGQIEEGLEILGQLQ